MKLVLLLVIACAAFAAADNGQKCVTDMVFLVDQSSSITRSDYDQTIKNFLLSFVRQVLHVDSPDGDRVAMVPFSDPDLTDVAFHFDTYTSTSALLEAIRTENFRGGNTATKKAFELARDSVFTVANGARNGSYSINVAPTLLIITDGVATDSSTESTPETVAADLRARGVSIFAIKVGSLVNDAYLAQLTGDETRVFVPSQYIDLAKSLAQAILESTTACSQSFGVDRI